MRRKLAAVLTGLALLSGSLAAADTLEQLQAKLAREKNPIKRVQITVKIGPLVLARAAQAYAEQRYEVGGAALEEYLDYIRRAHRNLEHSGRNARKKPKGFKELEIHLRKTSIQLEDLARAVPYAQRAPIEAAKQEVEDTWKKLVRALFGLPPRPANEPASGAAEEKGS
ncbi:MAG: hypothetical protein ACE5H2_06075 [Terriglobia bacterium]